ncbi:MAG: hypothetical protein IJ534_01075 [Bacteroidaceae bacterium]|nr:hypothetical protein [Bacteroidaceae bacterium]
MKTKLNALICNVVYSPIGNKIVSLLGGPKLYAEFVTWKRKKLYLSVAKQENQKGTMLGSLEDYRCALENHWVSYDEYAYLYEFYKKTEDERSEYVSLLKMFYFYKRYGRGVVLPMLRDKQKFLKAFSKVIHREWLYVPEATYDQFQQLITKYDCIVKPSDGARGAGIFKTYKEDKKRNDKELYEQCVRYEMVVEQCIEACDELKAFHPLSLNTIRVVTITGKDKSCVFSGVLRTGVGSSVVDNSHAGGVSAQINVKSGYVETDGADSKGKKYVCHPDSGIQFKGYRIPKWDLIVETCCSVAIELGNPITGFDVVVNNQGEIEFIEANFGPDLDVMQTRYGHGIKKELFSLIKEYCGIEMR